MPRGHGTGHLGAVWTLLLAACVAVGDDGPPAGWQEFEQKIDLDVEGSTVPVPLEGLDVWLTEDDDEPESWALHGNGTSVGGTFPMDVRVGYDDDFSRLIGKTIAISSRHLTIDGETASLITVPGAGRVQVLGGQMVIEKVERGWDAKTPLTGTIELQVRGGAGMLTLRGRLAVKGTGWG